MKKGFNFCNKFLSKCQLFFVILLPKICNDFWLLQNTVENPQHSLKVLFQKNVWTEQTPSCAVRSASTVLLMAPTYATPCCPVTPLCLSKPYLRIFRNCSSLKNFQTYILEESFSYKMCSYIIKLYPTIHKYQSKPYEIAIFLGRKWSNNLHFQMVHRY